MSEMQVLERYFKQDTGKREMQLRLDPNFAKYWGFLFECIDRLQYFMANILKCQQESMLVNRFYSPASTSMFPSGEGIRPLMHPTIDRNLLKDQ